MFSWLFFIDGQNTKKKTFFVRFYLSKTRILNSILIKITHFSFFLSKHTLVILLYFIIYYTGWFAITCKQSKCENITMPINVLLLRCSLSKRVYSLNTQYFVIIWSQLVAKKCWKKVLLTYNISVVVYFRARVRYHFRKNKYFYNSFIKYSSNLLIRD